MASQKPERPILAYLRASSAVGSFIGITGMILPAFFWWAASLFYLSLFIGLIDLFFEKSVNWAARLFFAVIILMIFYGFTFGIVRFPAPVEVQSFWTKSDYPSGTDVSGIKWRPGLSELHVSFHNPTDRDYEDFDLSMLTTGGIVQVAQVTSISCAPVSENVVSVHDTQSDVFHNLANEGPQRFRCDRLPAGATVQFLLATANIEDLMQSLRNPKIGSGIPPELYGPKKKPRWVVIRCFYRVTFRPHFFGKKMDVGDG